MTLESDEGQRRYNLERNKIEEALNKIYGDAQDMDILTDAIRARYFILRAGQINNGWTETDIIDMELDERKEIELGGRHHCYLLVTAFGI